MKIHAQLTVALAAAAILIFGLSSQTAQAQSGTAVLTPTGGISGNNSLSVNYLVTYGSGIYTYSYDVLNPTTGYVTGFNVQFSDTASVVVPSINAGGTLDPALGITWSPAVIDPSSSATFSFESTDPPGFDTANSAGTTPGPWASLNLGGQDVPVPAAVVPEPATTSLLALTLLLLPFRSTLLKKS